MSSPVVRLLATTTAAVSLLALAAPAQAAPAPASPGAGTPAVNLAGTYATCYGDEAYADYLEKAAQENAQRRPGEAEYYLTRTLGDALRGNDGV